MVAKVETTSESQFRRRFPRSGLRNFRADSSRAALPPHARCTMRDAECWHSPAGGKKQYYLDQEIALYLLGSGNNGRYCDAAAGRFLSEDPTKQDGTSKDSNSQLLAPNSSADINLYCYTGNDPINNLDPSGHDTKRTYHPPQNQQTQQHNPPPSKPKIAAGKTGHAAQGGASGHGSTALRPAQHHVADAHAHAAATELEHLVLSGQKPTVGEIEKLHLSSQEIALIFRSLHLSVWTAGDIEHPAENISWQAEQLREEARKEFPGLPLMRAYALEAQRANNIFAKQVLLERVPAFAAYQTLLYKFIRQLNPVQYLGEGTAALVTGREPVLGNRVSREQKALDMALYIALLAGPGVAAKALRGKELDDFLPRGGAAQRKIPHFNRDIAAHVQGGQGEAELAVIVQNIPNEQVVYWGGPIGSHGADVISVNTETGEVTFWDSKFRSRRTRIQESRTFTEKPARDNAIAQAEAIIRDDKSLPPAIRNKAAASLKQGIIRTRTVGFGKATNSTMGK